MTMQLKDVFKEIIPSLPEVAQETLKTSFPGLIQTARALKTDLLGTAAEAPPDAPEDREAGSRGHAVARKVDTEFWTLVALKKERLKLQQDLSAPDANSSELLVLPHLDTVADEKVKAELNALLTQEQALQTARTQMALSFAATPTLVRQRVAKRTNLDGVTTWTSQRSRPRSWNKEQPSNAPKTGDADKTALLHHSIMSEADRQITNLAKAAGASAVQK